MIRTGIVQFCLAVSWSRRIVAWPMRLAVAALIFFPYASRADNTTAAMDSSTAMAIPNLGGYHGLARVLEPSEAARMREIFRLQRSGRIADASNETTLLQDDTLLGEILADRYLSSGAKVDPSDLVAWLDRYRDHPEAGRIRALLARIDPGSAPSGDYASSSAGEFSTGLDAWKRGDYTDAAKLFETAWREQGPDSGRRSAAAFWAARSSLKGADVPAYLNWMTKAANDSPDFYSLLARHMLGVDHDTEAGRGILGEADIDGVLGTEAGYRAVALMEVGQISAAQQELDQLWLMQGNNPQLRRAIELVARQAGLRYPGRNIDNVVAPEVYVEDFPTLQPRGGFAFDPALIYALVRIESDFKSGLVSRGGARGLMQIMPVTVRAMARLGLVTGADRRQLYNPALNLEIGQEYLTYLRQQSSIHGDLIRTLASYNAGVGGFDRLDRGIDGTADPLLYIEEIPTVETKFFVLKVFAYAWLYAEERQEAGPGLDALAAGAFPNVAVLHSAPN